MTIKEENVIQNIDIKYKIVFNILEIFIYMNLIEDRRRRSISIYTAHIKTHLLFINKTFSFNIYFTEKSKKL